MASNSEAYQARRAKMRHHQRRNERRQTRAAKRGGIDWANVRAGVTLGSFALIAAVTHGSLFGLFH